MSSIKANRIASDIWKYLGEILLEEARDEILKSITVTGVEVTNDLSFCKIYFTSLMDMSHEALEREANGASHFVRGRLSEKLNIRHTPEIRFVYDKSIAYGEKIEKILNNLD